MLILQPSPCDLPRSGLYCLPHRRSVNKGTSCRGRSRDLIQKASRERRWWATVPKKPLAQVWMLFFYRKKKEVRQYNNKGISYSKYFLVVDVLISSFWQPCIDRSGQNISCELNASMLAYSSGMGARFEGMGQYVYFKLQVTSI